MSEARESLSAVLWRNFWKYARGEDREMVTSFVETGTVPRDLFEQRLESTDQRGYLSKRILKGLLEPMGLWKLFTDEEAEELYKRQPDLVFAYQVEPGSFWRGPGKVHKVLLRLRPVYMDYGSDGGPRIDLHGY